MRPRKEVGWGKSSNTGPLWAARLHAGGGFGLPELTYHSVKQLSSDAGARLRLLKLLSVSKLIPRLLLSPDAPESAMVQKRGGHLVTEKHTFGSVGSPFSTAT